MTKSFLRVIALALLWGVPFAGQAPTAAMADEATCCNCCPHCGCKLVPVCHIDCTTKKETTYKYTCNCESICVPGVTRCCDKCGCKGDCKCRIHEVKHLVKIPCVKEVPVRKCTVEWLCPHCESPAIARRLQRLRQRPCRRHRQPRANRRPIRYQKSPPVPSHDSPAATERGWSSNSRAATAVPSPSGRG